MISMDMNIQNTHLSLSLCRLKKIKIRRIFKYMATMASLSLLILISILGIFVHFFCYRHNGSCGKVSLFPVVDRRHDNWLVRLG